MLNNSASRAGKLARYGNKHENALRYLHKCKKSPGKQNLPTKSFIDQKLFKKNLR